MYVVAALARQTGRSLMFPGPASLAYLVNSGPVRDHVSKKKLDGIWETHEFIRWPLHTCTLPHMCPYTHIDIEGKLWALGTGIL